LNKPESWKTWVPLLGLLVLFGLVTAVWPALANAFELPSFGGGSSTRIPYEPEPIHLEAIKSTLSASSLPAPLASALAAAAEALPDAISPFLALGVVTGVVIGSIVVVGGGLSFLIKLIAGIRDNTLETETHQQHQQALEQRVNEQIKQMRDGRTTDPQPSHKMPRWSVISNIIIALTFVGFTTMVFVRNFFPEGITEIDGRIVNVTTPVFALLALITLVIAGLRIRPQKIEAVDETDSGDIPWDFIAVLITGLIMLGLGIGFMAYINAAPA
jgi:hypothetical protein